MRFRSRYALSAAILLSFGCNDYTTSSNIGPLEAPSSISSISLDSAIFLDWADNPFESDKQRFKWYNVYSASYDLNAGLCGTDWALEGTTVSHSFLVALLANGVPRCFATSAVSVENLESAWSPRWQDTPRPDARNVLVWGLGGTHDAQSGFRFWDDVNGNGYGDAGELGLVQNGNGAITTIDFWMHVDPADSTLWFVPEFLGDSMQLYQNSPIADLTSIDVAPLGGYTRDMYQAQIGYGYVFQRRENNQYHYAGLRVTAVTRQYVIFDWSVQTDSGNPELAPPRRPAMTGRLVALTR